MGRRKCVLGRGNSVSEGPGVEQAGVSGQQAGAAGPALEGGPCSLLASLLPSSGPSGSSSGPQGRMGGGLHGSCSSPPSSLFLPPPLPAIKQDTGAPSHLPGLPRPALS